MLLFLWFRALNRSGPLSRYAASPECLRLKQRGKFPAFANASEFGKLRSIAHPVPTEHACYKDLNGIKRLDDARKRAASDRRIKRRRRGQS
jgi:hypothetical protein